MDKKFHFAKSMRKAHTPSEDRLWEILRDKRAGGYKFRRQHRISPFVVDFYCAERRLVVEVDGDVHLHDEIQQRDFERQCYLENLGYRVVRVTSRDVMENPEGVLAFILQSVRE